MLNFFRQFTTALQDRFKTEFQVEPKRFLNEEVQLVADVENKQIFPFTYHYSYKNEPTISPPFSIVLFAVRGTTTPAIAYLNDLDTIVIEGLELSYQTGALNPTNTSIVIREEPITIGLSEWLVSAFQQINLSSTSLNTVVSGQLETPVIIRVGNHIAQGVGNDLQREVWTNIIARFFANYGAADSATTFFSFRIRGYYTKRYN